MEKNHSFVKTGCNNNVKNVVQSVSNSVQCKVYDTSEMMNG